MWRWHLSLPEVGEHFDTTAVLYTRSSKGVTLSMLLGFPETLHMHFIEDIMLHGVFHQREAIIITTECGGDLPNK